jgi:hypothetical protein
LISEEDNVVTVVTNPVRPPSCTFQGNEEKQGSLPRALAALAALFPVQLYWSRATLRAGLTYANVSRLQARYRVLYAVVGLAMVVALAAG